MGPPNPEQDAGKPGIIHFGINPDSVGSPPIDRRVMRTRIVMMGALFHVCDNDRVVVVELAINSVNMRSE